MFARAVTYVFVAGTLASSAWCAEAPPTSQPVTQPVVDAPALVREVRAGESWLDQVQSLRIEAESVATRSPQAIEKRREDLTRQFPNIKLTEKQFPELLERITASDLFAFDQKRYLFHQSQPAMVDDWTIWDGTPSLSRMQWHSSPSDGYSIKKAREWPKFSWNHAWPIATHHSVWWNVPEDKELQRLRSPENYEYLRTEKVDGMDCYILSLRGWNLERWAVGVQDHRLHRYEFSPFPTSEEELPAYIAEAAKRGVTVRNDAELSLWLSTLTKQDRAPVDFAASTVVDRTVTAGMVYFYDHYTEVSAGCWYPMHQQQITFGYRMKDGKPVDADWRHPWADLKWETQVTNVAVNETLPDDLFQMKFEEGLNVWDETYDPPLSYRYKKDRSPEEWTKLVENARQMREKGVTEKQAKDALIGTVAPAFPQMTWINSEPLTWEKLKGKWVVLDFFAEWCGPCRDVLPQAADAYHDRVKNGLTIIGVHTPGSKPEAITKLLNAFKIDYPVCVDVPTETKAAWGRMYEAYHIGYIPYAVLIDPSGKIVGHGSLGEMVHRAAVEYKGGIE